MNSRKGGGNSSNDQINNPSYKGKGTSHGSFPAMDQLIGGVSGMNMDPAQDGAWEIYGKKSKNKTAMRSPGGSRGGSSQNWQTMSSDSRKPSGRSCVKPQLSNQGMDADYTAPPFIPPPLKNGWAWSGRTASPQTSDPGHKENAETVNQVDAQASRDDNVSDSNSESDGDDTDDDDEFESQKSHTGMKESKWFKQLFERLDLLKAEDITDPEREWHCPACKGGPGAIDWYRGLQPLITHAKTVRSKRVKLHRALAEVLDEELRRRGTAAVPAGEIFGKWKGPGDSVDKEIVWPPMVIIMNTLLEKDDNDKWIGMGNQELIDYFGSYSAMKARHSYGPQGHRGMSVLLFESSAVGYMEAERLNKHFEETGCDKLAWRRNKIPFYPGGKRQLYGYMAEKTDIESFNKHSQGKSKLKYEMRSYQEMVNQMKQMSEDNQKLTWMKNKYTIIKQSEKVLQESNSFLSEKLRKTTEENRIVKLRTKKYHEQTKEEMDYQEIFYREQMQKFYDDRNAKEENFEKNQQNQREKVAQFEGIEFSVEDGTSREEKIAKFNKLQDNVMEEFKKKRDILVKEHKENMLMLREAARKEVLCKLEDEEKKFDEKFDKLLKEYSPKC